MFRYAVLVCTFAAVLLSAAGAEQRGPVTPGMTMGEVLRIWGPPEEKMDQEAHRREVWRYGSKALVFHEGRLREEREIVRTESNTAPRESRAGGPPHAAARGVAPERRRTDAPRGGASPVRTPQTTREILSEIMRQYPDDGVVDASRAPAVIPPSQQPMVPPNAGPPSEPVAIEQPMDDEMGL